MSHDLLAYLESQKAWSIETFGPGERTVGILNHIAEELGEVAQDPGDVSEWIDIVILALDGAWRAGHSPKEIADALWAKHEKNKAREWPDWRQFTNGEPINHIRKDNES